MQTATSSTGLSWWLSGKEFTCQRRKHRFDPRSEKIPRAMVQQSPCATTTEPMLQSPRAATTELTCPTARAPQQEKPLQ